MSNFVTQQRPFPNKLSAEEILQLENEEKILRVLQPDILERIKQCPTASRQRIEPFVVENNDAVYFSFLNVKDAEQRRSFVRKIQQWQLGIDVDLSNLPQPLHQLLQPHRVHSQRLMRVLILGAITGTIAGVLAMAVSVLVISGTELILGASFNAFGEMQITAVAFVIFAVLGWMVATPFFWHRSKQ
ncbi:MAG: hypothetical protein H6667_24080 [Ardenticatenaceae bacterium]|nr:hypothetical protein [Ardenticatenaceae bacterium]